MAQFVVWYRRADYQRVRKIMTDGKRLPNEFDEWEVKAQSQMETSNQEGLNIKPFLLDLDEFIAFCEAKKIPCDSLARAKFVADHDATGSG